MYNGQGTQSWSKKFGSHGQKFGSDAKTVVFNQMDIRLIARDEVTLKLMPH